MKNLEPTAEIVGVAARTWVIVVTKAQRNGIVVENIITKIAERIYDAIEIVDEGQWRQSCRVERKEAYAAGGTSSQCFTTFDYRVEGASGQSQATATVNERQKTLKKRKERTRKARRIGERIPT